MDIDKKNGRKFMTHTSGQKFMTNKSGEKILTNKSGQKYSSRISQKYSNRFLTKLSDKSLTIIMVESTVKTIFTPIFEHVFRQLSTNIEFKNSKKLYSK